MSLLESPTSVRLFCGLKSYSRTDVELINRFGDLFRTEAAWESWVQEGLGTLLEESGDRSVLLQRTNQIASRDTQALSFQKDEISIGREADNDVVIALAGVGRHHARITQRDGSHFLEDLGSANGTYLNDTKLTPGLPVLLDEHAQFLIFPYQFTFSTRQEWHRQEPIRVAASTPQVTQWNENRSRSFGGERLYNVKVAPDLGSAVIRVSDELLKTLVHRSSRTEAARLVPADAGLFEFLLLSVLERANRELRFPFRFSLAPFEAPPKGQRGVSIECSLGLNGRAGTIELFLPDSLLREIRHSAANNDLSRIPVSWPVMATMGYSDLKLQELAELELSDILLITSVHTLQLPAAARSGERGWRAVLMESDRWRLKVEAYFERSDLTMETQAPSPDERDLKKPDLGALPVRVHIVLSQLDMTLTELNTLRPGTIVELDCEKSESVQLAVNGKIAGSGELVDIEGRLGVRISRWKSQ